MVLLLLLLLLTPLLLLLLFLLCCWRSFHAIGILGWPTLIHNGHVLVFSYMP